MNEIKFRGLDAQTGKTIYSDSILVRQVGNGNETAICLRDQFGNWLFIEAESLAQFVGYDADNKEVYEGDILQNQDREFPVRVMGSATVKTWDIGDKIYYWNLKESKNDEDFS